jgi:predicted RNA-binding Zn-ribbon protein involved in translation (DUF1610 family)
MTTDGYEYRCPQCGTAQRDAAGNEGMRLAAELAAEKEHCREATAALAGSKRCGELLTIAEGRISALEAAIARALPLLAFNHTVEGQKTYAALQKLLTVPKTPLCPCGAFEMDGKILHSAKCAAGSAAETGTEPCHTCGKPLPPLAEWSTPHCPDCTDKHYQETSPVTSMDHGGIGDVGCERPDGTLNIHSVAETCEVCAPTMNRVGVK